MTCNKIPCATCPLRYLSLALHARTITRHRTRNVVGKWRAWRTLTWLSVCINSHERLSQRLPPKQHPLERHEAASPLPFMVPHAHHLLHPPPPKLIPPSPLPRHLHHSPPPLPPHFPRGGSSDTALKSSLFASPPALFNTSLLILTLTSVVLKFANKATNTDSATGKPSSHYRSKPTIRPH